LAAKLFDLTNQRKGEKEEVIFFLNLILSEPREGGCEGQVFFIMEASGGG